MIPASTLISAEREVVFHLADAGGAPIVGHFFIDADVQVAAPGSAGAGAYANFDHTRVKERGHGDYAYEMTDAQAATKGVWSFYVNVGGAVALNITAEVRDIDNAAAAVAILDAVADPNAPVGAQTLRELVNIIASFAAGKASGLDGPVSAHQAINTPPIGDRKNRIEATVIAGKRTITKLDGTP